MQKVFVIDKAGKSCLPCHPARARKLLKIGKAKLIQVVPFTIQLNYEINDPLGSFTVGIDDGAKHVGVAIVNGKTNEVVFKGTIQLRQDVKRKMLLRAQYRRARRSRNLRYRKPRFKNRISSKLVPSIRYRKDTILRFIKDMSKRVNITKAVVEEVKFNHSKFKYGKFFSLVEIGKIYLKEQILKLNLIYGSIFGVETKERRMNLELSKTHSNDAITIVCKEIKPVINSLEWIIKPRRTKIWENNPTKICNEKNGFRHYDIVKAIRKNIFYIGIIRSLKSKKISIRTRSDNNFAVSYNKTILLQRPGGLMYIF
jgi:hypothetical protein